jgi:demethylmacrocin O-methyltransferase
VLKTIAVRWVKPVLSDGAWQRLRRLGDQATDVVDERKRQRRLAAMSLTELGREFGTDKVGLHHYTQHYERHLRHLRDESFTLLEIGIGGYEKQLKGGHSLRMWKQFFPRAQIVGLDIHDKSFAQEDRIRTYQGSQVDPAVLDRIVKDAHDLRVVIDDGSHECEHVRETFRLLFPRLPDGAIYCIEDTQTSYWPERGGSADLDAKTTSMALVKELVDGLNYEEFIDDDYEPTYTDLNVVAVHCYHNLVVIEKGTNVEGTNRVNVRRRYELRKQRGRVAPV